jgi:hypothetical protein
MRGIRPLIRPDAHQGRAHRVSRTVNTALYPPWTARVGTQAHIDRCPASRSARRAVAGGHAPGRRRCGGRELGGFGRGQRPD